MSDDRDDDEGDDRAGESPHARDKFDWSTAPAAALEVTGGEPAEKALPPPATANGLAHPRWTY